MDIDNWGEVHVDADGFQLFSYGVGGGFCEEWVLRGAESAISWEEGEAVSQARHNASFLVNGDEEGNFCLLLERMSEGFYL